MIFKKTKIHKKPLSQKIIPFLVSFFAIIIISSIWVFGWNAVKDIQFNFFDFIQGDFINSSKSWEKDKKINILFIWRGWGDHDAPNLTDTIILGSIDFESNIISMFSIPRDLYIETNEGYKFKINEIYSRNLSENEDNKEESLQWLEEKITEITGENIDYYVSLDFEWFKEIIDLFWWIEITFDENFVDYQYPNGSWGYRTLVFRKWTWILDGEDALKYARSRHSTSDFDRSIRQQKIIMALKKRAEEEWILQNAWQIKDLYDIARKYVFTNLDTKTLINIILKLKEDNTILSFNLNDSCSYWGLSCIKWWFLYTPDRNLFWGASVLLPEWATIRNLSNYEEIQKFTDLIFNYREIYKENYQINIFNSTRTPALASSLANDLIRFGFYFPEQNAVWNIRDEVYEQTIIYYNGIEENSETLTVLKQILNIPFEKKDFPVYSKDPNTKIEIILGNDYETLNLNF